MYIKRYTANTVREAMKSIKADLGKDALILNTKKISTGKGECYEVVAALERNPVDETTSTVPPSLTGPATGSNRRRPADLYANAASSVAAPQAVASSVSGIVSAEAVASVSLSGAGVEGGAVSRAIAEELNEIKSFCTKVMAATKTPLSDVLGNIEAEMLKNGIDKRLVNNILIKTCSRMADEQLYDKTEFKNEMKRRVSKALKVEDPLTEDGTVMAFIGPTGVGKTTTIAKLAAINALKKKKRVALLTFDNYRIAAVEQLKIYGKLIGTPVELAKTPGELAGLIRSHADKDLVLIDTAGRDRSNMAHLGELQALSALNPRVKFNLVLSSQTRDTTLYENVKKFSPVGIDSLTFTKIDESDVYGPIFNTMVLAGKSLAYLTNGQRVPEDIEVATKERLLDIFLPC